LSNTRFNFDAFNDFEVRSIMATQTRCYRASTRAIQDALDVAFDKIGARGVRWARGNRRVSASMGMTIFVSYGEDMVAEIFEDGEVEVRSTSSFPLQWDIWGKNSGNCRKFLDAVSYELDE